MSRPLDFDEWAEGTCSYMCQLCGSFFRGRARFNRHLDTNHDTDILKYMAKHGEALTSKITASCDLCGVKVLHDKSALLDHLGTCHHGFDLFRYYKTFVNKNVVVKQKRKYIEVPENGCAGGKKKPSILELEARSHRGACESVASIAQDDPIAEIGIEETPGGLLNEAAAVQSQPIAENSADIIVSMGEGDQVGETETILPEDEPSSSSNSPVQEKYSSSATAQESKSEEGLRQMKERLFSNQCEYTCAECPNGSKFKTDDLLRLEKHVGQTHKERERKGSLICVEMVTTAVNHTCLVCQCTLLQDRQVITRHIRKVHGMKDNEYISMSDIPTEMEYAKQYLAKHSQQELRVMVPHVDFIGKIVEPGIIPVEHTTNFVANLCVFDCTICQEVKYSWPALRHHLATVHLLDPCKFLPKYIAQTRYHQCKLCRWCVVCDVTFLTNHVLSKHKMTLREYSNMGEADDVKTNNSSPVVIAKKQKVRQLNDKVPIERLRSSDKHGRDKLKALVPQIAFFGRVVDDGEIPPENTTTSVGNLCAFQCDICQVVKFSWGALRSHLKVAHFLDSCRFKPKYIVETRYHRCKLCESCVVCDVAFVTAHLISRHKINLKDYTTGKNAANEKFENDESMEEQVAPGIVKVESRDDSVAEASEFSGSEDDFTCTDYVKTELVEEEEPPVPTVIPFARRLPKQEQHDPLAL